MQPIGVRGQSLSNDVLAKWLIEDFPFRIQLSPVFPFYSVGGDSLRYASTGPLAAAATVDQCSTLPEDTKQPGDANRVFRFAEIATHFRVCYKAQDVFSSNVNDQAAVQMALAVRELLYKFWRLFESGNSATNPAEFDGLLKLVDAANVVDLGGHELMLEDLDRAKEQVRTKDGRSVVAFTSSIGKRAILAAHYSRGLSPQHSEVRVASPCGNHIKQHVLTFDGAPVFINDLNQVFEFEGDQPGNLISPEKVSGFDGLEPVLGTNIWFFALGGGSLHGILPSRSRHIIVRSTILADASTLVYHVTMPAGIALGSLSALSVIKNATIPRANPPGQRVRSLS